MRTEVKLENGTLLKVGEKYRQDHYDVESWIEVTALGRQRFLLITDCDNLEQSGTYNEDWIPYEEEEMINDLKKG